MSLPTISIVTPSLNQGRFIRAALTSVLEQDYAPLEYIVMDGGSLDESCSIVRAFAGRVTLVSRKDDGQSDAINKGFAAVSGEIIAWLNADDCYAPGALRKVAAIFRDRPEISLVFGDAEWMDEYGNHVGRARQLGPFSLRELLTLGNFIVQPAAFFRRAAFNEVGGLRKDLRWSMDYDLWIRLGKSGEAYYLPETLAFVRHYPETKSASGGRARIIEFESVARVHGASCLPSWFALEAARMFAGEAVGNARDYRFRSALGAVASAASSILGSPAVIQSLRSRRTWDIILTSLRRDRAIFLSRRAGDCRLIDPVDTGRSK